MTTVNSQNYCRNDLKILKSHSKSGRKPSKRFNARSEEGQPEDDVLDVSEGDAGGHHEVAHIRQEGGGLRASMERQGLSI